MSGNEDSNNVLDQLMNYEEDDNISLFNPRSNAQDNATVKKSSKKPAVDANESITIFLENYATIKATDFSVKKTDSKFELSFNSVIRATDALDALKSLKIINDDALLIDDQKIILGAIEIGRIQLENELGPEKPLSCSIM